MELSLLGNREQLVVRNTAPQEEGQARCKLDIADPVHGSGSGVRRINLGTEEELGRDQNLLQRQSHARLEAAILRALLIEREQLRHVVGAHGPPIGTVGEVRQDFLRAAHFVGSPGRMTDENLVAGDCVPRSFDIERARNGNAAHAFEVGLHVVVTDLIDNAFLKQCIFQEDCTDRTRAGLDG